MDAEAQADWELLQRLFRGASALAPDERAAFLAGATTRESIRRQVAELLDAHDDSESLLGQPLLRHADLEEQDFVPEVPGFRILHELGRGGMGVVYAAQQEQPPRTVALKVLRPGLVAPGLARRFEHEARLLARLQHPGIAQIFGVGVSAAASGALPYFALELVHGQPLGEYARERALDLTARLELLARIADAVHHAHQRGVIHRDLKPSNILVTEAGDPKILDFGIARNTDAEAQVTRLHTDIGQLIGTLPYMSPEQTRGDSEALDTRSDVYALGVIGYELLGGRLPYEVNRRLLPEAVRVIQEQEPTRLRELDRALRGDVETIVEKALEKQPDRRYAGASELAADIRRFLDNEPIVARPTSRAYQLRKFARRNRLLVGSGLTLLLVLLVASIVSTRLAIARARALTQARLANLETERRSSIALEVRAFLEEAVLGQADPFVNPDREMTVATALNNAARALDGRFPHEPEVEQSLRMTLASTLDGASRYAEAEPQAVRARTLARQVFGDDSAEARAAERLLARIHASQGQYQGAEQELEALLARERALPLASDSERVHTLGELGRVLNMANRFERATERLEEALALCAGLGEAARGTRWQLQHDLAESWLSLGRHDAARVQYERVLEAQRAALGAEHATTLATRYSLAVLARDAGRFEQAEALCRELLEPCERVLGLEHAGTLAVRTVLAGCLHELGRFEPALELLRQNLADQERALGADSLEALKTEGQIADALLRLGRLEEAEPFALHALAGLRARVGERHDFTLLALGRMGVLRKAQGRLEEAREQLEQAREVALELFGAESLESATLDHNLGAVSEALGRFDEAARLYREAADANAKLFGEQDARVLTSLAALANTQQRLGKLEEAEALYLQVIDGFAETIGPRYWVRGNTLQDYALCVERLGRPDEAVELLQEAVSILDESFGPEHVRTRIAQRELTRLQAH